MKASKDSWICYECVARVSFVDRDFECRENGMRAQHLTDFHLFLFGLSGPRQNQPHMGGFMGNPFSEPFTNFMPNQWGNHHNGNRWFNQNQGGWRGFDPRNSRDGFGYNSGRGRFNDNRNGGPNNRCGNGPRNHRGHCR